MSIAVVHDDNDTAFFFLSNRPQVKDFDAAQYFSAKKSMRSNDRVTHFAVAATKLAIEDAGVDVAACGERCGVMVRS